MNTLKSIGLLVCLVAAVSAHAPKHVAHRGNSLNNMLKPTEWLSVSQLENLPSVDEMSLKRLEDMTVDEGADLINKIYHLSQIERDIEPSYVPNVNEIPAYIVEPTGRKVTFELNELVTKAKEIRDFGDDEVTIFITGLPEEYPSVKKATNKLVRAYMERYNIKQQRQQTAQMNKDYDYENKKSIQSNEDDEQEWKTAETTTGDLIVIDLGKKLVDFKRIVMLDTQKTGQMLARLIIQLTEELRIPFENIHVVAQGISAHVAGSAGREFTRLTGHKLRRITALDPSKIYTKHPYTLVGLTRGDAEFVDAIHTTAYGMGTVTRVGNVDFYPNGPSYGVPGADNIIEATMRATRYFAESVRPGYERNFPAVPAVSVEEYKNNEGYGKRTYMGIATDYDLEGDYILQVNSKSPFGKSTPARKQMPYHDIHTPERYWNVEQTL